MYLLVICTLSHHASSLAKVASCFCRLHSSVGTPKCTVRSFEPNIAALCSPSSKPYQSLSLSLSLSVCVSVCLSPSLSPSSRNSLTLSRGSNALQGEGKKMKAEETAEVGVVEADEKGWERSGPHPQSTKKKPPPPSFSFAQHSPSLR